MKKLSLLFILLALCSSVLLADNSKRRMKQLSVYNKDNALLEEFWYVLDVNDRPLEMRHYVNHDGELERVGLEHYVYDSLGNRIYQDFYGREYLLEYSGKDIENELQGLLLTYREGNEEDEEMLEALQQAYYRHREEWYRFTGDTLVSCTSLLYMHDDKVSFRDSMVIEYMLGGEALVKQQHTYDALTGRLKSTYIAEPIDTTFEAYRYTYTNYEDSTRSMSFDQYYTGNQQLTAIVNRSQRDEYYTDTLPDGTVREIHVLLEPKDKKRKHWKETYREITYKQDGVETKQEFIERGRVRGVRYYEYQYPESE